MAKGKVTINGVMIDLGSVKFFNKVDKFNKKRTEYNQKKCKDCGIEFVFYGGGRKTVWWYSDPGYSSCNCLDYERDMYYDRLMRDFGIKEY